MVIGVLSPQGVQVVSPKRANAGLQFKPGKEEFFLKN
jgi:hypothetical protein